jgi:hypothetical protein
MFLRKTTVPKGSQSRPKDLFTDVFAVPKARHAVAEPYLPGDFETSVFGILNFRAVWDRDESHVSPDLSLSTVAAGARRL